MSTVPADPAGETAVIDVSETMVKLAAGVPPKSTYDAAMKPDPVMVTVVPPAVEPEFGLIPVTDG